MAFKYPVIKNLMKVIYLYFNKLFVLDRFRITRSLGFNRFFDLVL